MRPVTLFALAVLVSFPANAHDWYPSICCSQGDCFAVEDEDILELTTGMFEIVPTGQLVDSGKVYPSEDGRYHVCTSKLKDFSVPVKCLFVPPRGF